MDQGALKRRLGLLLRLAEDADSDVDEANESTSTLHMSRGTRQITYAEGDADGYHRRQRFSEERHRQYHHHQQQLEEREQERHQPQRHRHHGLTQEQAPDAGDDGGADGDAEDEDMDAEDAKFRQDRDLEDLPLGEQVEAAEALEQRRRERNKLHARRTRERKKQQLQALQVRMRHMTEELQRLRRLEKGRFEARDGSEEGTDTSSNGQATSGSEEGGGSRAVPISCGPACGVLGDAGSDDWEGAGDGKMEKDPALPPSSSSPSSLSSAHKDAKVSRGLSLDLDEALRQLEGLGCDGMWTEREDSMHELDSQEQGSGRKRARIDSTCSLDERQRLRRERNKVHARRTRERKKRFLETSEAVIDKISIEIERLRERLRLGQPQKEEARQA